MKAVRQSLAGMWTLLAQAWDDARSARTDWQGDHRQMLLPGIADPHRWESSGRSMNRTK